MKPPLTRRLRTTIVSPFGELGGAELWLLGVLDHTERLDAEAVLLRDGPLRAELTARGVPVVVHPTGRGPRDVAEASSWLRRHLQAVDPDVVMSNGVKAAAVAGPSATALGVPSVWIKHDHSFDRTLTPVLARLATKVMVVTEEMQRTVRRRDVEVIEPPRPSEPPLPRQRARSCLEAYGLDAASRRLTLVMMTRLVPYKGVDVAIQALAHPEADRWDLAVFGGEDASAPAERERLVALADALGILDRVHLFGHVDHARTLLSGCDALAMLTRRAGRRTPGREAFGMAAMEAMIAGLPVVAPDDGGTVAARIGHGAGLLVDATDPRSVGQALATLSDDTTRDRMATVALQRAEQFAGRDEVADRVVRLLCAAALRPGAGIAKGPPMSVVSPVLNERPVIDRLVHPLLEQASPADELVVVDAGSTDGTRERLDWWRQQDGRLRVVDVNRGSIGASRNAGVQAAQHATIACTDAGCRPDPQWLDSLRAAAAETLPTDLVVGTYRVAVRPERLFEVAMSAVAWPDPDELRRQTPARRVWSRMFGLRFAANRVDGRSVAFSKVAWLRAGGFPEHLATAEDEAFGAGVLRSGGSSQLCQDATVTWFQRESIVEAFQQFRGYGRGGGHSRSSLLVRKDVLRLLAYAAGVAALTKGTARTRLGVGACSALLLSYPTRRLLRRDHPKPALLLVPFAQVLKDSAKVLGAFEAVFLRRTKGASAAAPSPSGLP
jgi:hypothetical protein